MQMYWLEDTLVSPASTGFCPGLLPGRIPAPGKKMLVDSVEMRYH